MTELTDATFYAPLKTTLVPTNGTGSATFTRATTKRIFDNEGKSIEVKSGAAGLAGARAVQNIISNTSDLTGGMPVSASGATLTGGYTDRDGGNNAYRLLEKSNLDYHFMQGTFSSLAINEYCGSVYVKPAGGRYIILRVVVDGGGAGNYCSVCVDTQTITVTSTFGSTTYYGATDGGNGWVRIYAVRRSTLATIGYLSIAISNTSTPSWDNGFAYYTGTSTLGFDIYQPQFESVSHLSTKTPSEYVSVGALSAPFHGASVDGVKYFATNKDLTAIPDATMLGAHIDPASKTNNLLHCRDLTNAVWIKTNCTPLKTQTGIDGLASGCSLLTSTAADATCLQTITAAATAACSGFYVKRYVGTGSVYITRDGGSNWTDITSLINSSAFACVKIENTSITNPQVGFKIATSGDAIIVDAGLNHTGTQLCEPILTTTAAVTRNAEVLTYQTSGNFSDTAGTVLATFRPTYDTWPSGSIVGKASFGLLSSTANSGVQAADGTNTVSGLAGTPSGQLRIGARWSGSSLQAFHETNYGAVGSYDGNFNLATIAINSGVPGYIRDIAIFNSSLDDADMPWYVAPEVPEAPTVNAGGGGGGGYRSLGSYLVEEQVSNDDRDVLDFIQVFLLTRK